MILAMGAFLGTLSYSSYAASNGVAIVKHEDDKKKKKKGEAKACCSKDAAKSTDTSKTETSKSEAAKTEAKTCAPKGEGEKACCAKKTENK